MLFAIGAVLSVLLLLFPESFGLKIAACIAWTGTVIAAVADLILLCVFRKGEPEEDQMTRERDRFLSDVAHELKTPLTVIRGSAEVLADGAVPVEEYPEYCARILRETEAMSHLVGDLLDVARLRAGRVRFEPRDVDLSYLCRSVCDSMGTVAGKKSVNVRFVDLEPALPVLLLDYDRIRQLLVILLDNAVKHAPEGTEVVLTLTRTPDCVGFSVTNGGTGISDEDLPYVFERFYKADASRGGLAAGSGIGLSIARQIVLLHEGDIRVDNKIAGKTCFSVSLPLREYKNTEDA